MREKKVLHFAISRVIMSVHISVLPDAIYIRHGLSMVLAADSVCHFVRYFDDLNIFMGNY